MQYNGVAEQGRRARSPPEGMTGKAEHGSSGESMRPISARQDESSLPRIPSADSYNGNSGRKGKAKGANASTSGMRSGHNGGSSSPSLGAPPKDLGTMIYLLGTQSSSMNARRLAQATGPS